MDFVGKSQTAFSYYSVHPNWASKSIVPVELETHHPKSFWQDERVFPAYFAAISLLSLVVRGIIHSTPVARLWSKAKAQPPPVVNSDEPETVWGKITQIVERTGSTTIFIFKLVRLVLVNSLFALVLAGAVKAPWTRCSYASVATMAYAVLLAISNLLAPAARGRTYSFHLSIILFAVFSVYAYRDVWPLMTFTLRPLDEAEGLKLWVKVALAALAGVVEPLFEPYPYIPVNPNSPSTPSAEQTASLFMFLTYTFLDPIIYKAYHVEHLPLDEFPPLCDYDSTAHLIKKSYPRLDPFSRGKKGRLLFDLLRIFWKPFMQQAFILLGSAFAGISVPVGTNRLLNYLETAGEDALVKPWIWVVIIALAPLGVTICFQLYMFKSTGTLVRAEAIIMSLVFDHALRIRLKAEAAERKSSSFTGSSSTSVTGTDTKGSNTPETDSTHDGDETDTVHSHNVSATSTTTAATSSTATVVAPTAATPSAKPGDQKDVNAKAKDSEKGKKNIMGKINNLVTSDLSNITGGRDFLFLIVSAPLNITLGMWFLYTILGWSSFVGLAVMVLLVPLPAKVASLMRGVTKKKMEATDSRVQNVTEMMSVLRMIKLFGWESRISNSVAEKRENELIWIWKRKVLGLLNTIINHTVPLIHMFVTYATFTLVQKQPLSASIVFSSITTFSTIRQQVFRVFGMLPQLIQANVSLGRVAEFLYDTELLDEFSDPSSIEELIVDSPAAHKEDIGFCQVSFAWSNDTSDGTITPSRQAFRLHIDNEVVFKQGGFNLIVGPTGSGKTSVLMALLGEMHYIPSGPESWKNLPREGGVSYAAQESWVQNETIKENIVFGAPYDEERYKKVIYQCALTRDLSLFEAGDATEVGEKGLTLSGGQKARITLARAVYSKSDIVLLDDVLAALDVHTARWIVDKCFKGDILRGRTILLVTHNIALAGPLADFVISLNTDGHIISQGSISEALASDSRLAEVIQHEEEAVELDESEESATEEKPADEKNGKLVVAEEIAVGHVSWSAFKLFVQGLGGQWPIFFWLQYITGIFGAEVFDIMEMWWRGYSAQQYALKNPQDVNIGFYMGIYGVLVTAVVISRIFAELIYTIGTLRAARSLHASLIKSLLGSTFRWLDITPTSRVITRCTQDIQSVDTAVANDLNYLIGIAISAAVSLVAVVAYTPSFLAPACAVAVLGVWVGNIYMKAQLSVKREMSNAKSPVLGILGGAISGLTSIRAYGAQDAFRQQILFRVDRYVRSSRVFNNLNRWISIRIDLLAAFFSAGLAFYLVYGGKSYSPSNVGFVLTMAVSFSELILWWVRIYNDFEVSGNSLERIQQYITIEQEPEPKDSGAPPAYWPSSGSLEVENLTARYSPDGPKVLENVTFRVKAGERVGIVGRTGSGKSTLTLALLRCIYTEGTVVFDGILTHTLNLDALRSNVTIIPQVPELLSGSLRHNLDVFEQYDDATLNDALRAAGLFSLQRLSDENRMALDTEIASGGGNLSVGQRQIIALARAIVRQSKLLILDEATSAIDYETDAVIQASLRNELSKDVTVITVAHRLQTIMDADKIMVLDAGHLIEFDSPKVLLEREDSLLRALVDESADKQTLYDMAERKGAASSA